VAVRSGKRSVRDEDGARVIPGNPVCPLSPTIVIAAAMG
jgi:hypothetical protein